MTLIPQTGHALSPSLRDVVPEIPNPIERVIPRPRAIIGPSPTTSAPVNDTALQQMTSAATRTTTAIGLNFDGMIAEATPPDPNLSVGATQVVQIENGPLTVFSKLTGAKIYTAEVYTIFAALGGPCATYPGFDPIVVYDKLADRWLISEANNLNNPDQLLCVAVSQTSDATGRYYLYSFDLGDTYADYQKFGVWPGAYYVSLSYDPDAGACAFPRSAMLTGQSVSGGICFPKPKSSQGNDLGVVFLPADLDGSTPPPTGEPGFFLTNAIACTITDCRYTGVLDLFRFHADFTIPSNSTFTGPFSVQGVAPFNNCSTGGSVPQPGTAQGLVSYCGWLMYRLAYRNFGDHESLVVTHDAQVSSSSTQIGIRWYEIRDPNGTPTVYQQGTYAPDTTTYRWMGSASQDRNGNIAVGYSVSDPTSVYPGIRYTGRRATDPLNTLEAEATVVNGSASITMFSGRWGDYSSMSIDPVDDCTFWYTTEYVVTDNFHPNTRLVSFKFNSCGADFTISAAPGAQSVLPGGAAKFVLTLTAAGGFSDAVNLSCSKLPPGADCKFDSSSITPKNSGSQATLTVTTPPTLAQGNYSVTIAAASGGLQHTQDVQVVVGGISGSVTPSSATIAVGSSANFAVSLHSSGGFSGPVNLACSGVPSGTNCTFAPAQVSMAANGSASSTLMVQVSAKPSVSAVPGAQRNTPAPASPSIPAGLPKVSSAMALSVVLVLAALAAMLLRLLGGDYAAKTRALTALVLAVALSAVILSCGGTTKSSTPSGTGATVGTGGSGGSGGSSGGTGGGGSSVTTQFTVQAQSGGATVNLGTVSVTVP